MQLWHGTTDTTLAYPNFGEEIKQWTNLHGLSQTPAFTDHPQSSWTRTRYGDTGTQATVEGISIAGTGHTLPQAGMLAYAITFLGLDRAVAAAVTHRRAALRRRRAVPRRTGPVDTARHPDADLGLPRRGEPAVDPHGGRRADRLLRIVTAVPRRPGRRDGSRHRGDHLDLPRRRQPEVAPRHRTAPSRTSRSGLCLDVSRAATANGTKVILWTCTGRSNQQWTHR